MAKKILLLGAAGQIGTELTSALIQKYGADNVIASDIKSSRFSSEVNYEQVDATSFDAIYACIKKHRINTVYLMAAMLSATGEKYPQKAWNLNMTSLIHVLELAREGVIEQIFWPSSIAVFGGTTPKLSTPQITITEPSTVYGISKLAGERWCAYYSEKYNVDVRSVRFPGIISWKAKPGGGTTDYAVEIFHEAVKHSAYTCFLNADTALPMMFMDDAIHATITLMEADKSVIKSFVSYNISAMSFTPAMIASEIQKIMPDFKISYQPDYRQNIAESWPSSIDDSAARQDWNWKPKFDLSAMVHEMISQLEKTYLSTI